MTVDSDSFKKSQKIINITFNQSQTFIQHDNKKEAGTGLEKQAGYWVFVSLYSVIQEFNFPRWTLGLSEKQIKLVVRARIVPVDLLIVGRKHWPLNIPSLEKGKRVA